MKKKINSAFSEEDYFEEIISRDIRRLGNEISMMSQKQFRRGYSETLKYYRALRTVSEYYGLKNWGI